MDKILLMILNLVQPVAVFSFLVAGVACLFLGEGYRHQGVINICFSIANFAIFYGGRFLK